MSHRVVLVLILLKCSLAEYPCRTLNGGYGECKPLSSCQSLTIESSNSNCNVRRHYCGFLGEEPKVCCPIKEHPKRKPNVYTSPSLLPSTDDCGIHVEDKIVGGEIAGLDEFPWMALLRYENIAYNNESFLCGGALINNRYVLTAAHCLQPHLIGVRLGEHNTSSEIDCIANTCAPPPLDIGIEKKITFDSSNCSNQLSEHDIALLRLDQEVPYSHFIRPICLPVTYGLIRKSYIESKVTVAGWGYFDKYKDVMSDVKRKIELLVTTCKRLMLDGTVALDDGQICAGGVLNKDSCRGDSGGPLMSLELDEEKSFHWYAVGVLSFGSKTCGNKGTPGVYNRVSNYIYWIQDNLKP